VPQNAGSGRSGDVVERDHRGTHEWTRARPGRGETPLVAGLDTELRLVKTRVVDGPVVDSNSVRPAQSAAHGQYATTVLGSVNAPVDKRPRAT